MKLFEITKENTLLPIEGNFASQAKVAAFIRKNSAKYNGKTIGYYNKRGVLVTTLVTVNLVQVEQVKLSFANGGE